MKKDAKNDIGMLKKQADQAKATLRSVRDNQRFHVAHPGFKEYMEYGELFDLLEDIQMRADTRDTSKPIKRLGPTNDVPQATMITVDTTKGIESLLEQIVVYRRLQTLAPGVFLNCSETISVAKEA